MIIFKSKNKLWDLNWKQVGDWYFGAVNDSYKLLVSSIESVEEKIDKIEIDDGFQLLVKSPIPGDLQKNKVDGIPVILADGNEWIIKTIAHVNYKLVLKNGNEFFEACDPLFDMLIERADKMKEGVDINSLVDIIVACLEQNYYLNRKIVSALGLLTTDLIEDIVKKIYMWGQSGNDFFR
ncbi:MAG TPA: hypothetical protein PLA12_14220 [Candidatus Hydrogenedens sp.]|nr:hypothetical protein [Candidatus Hydrogenedens sp.]